MDIRNVKIDASLVRRCLEMVSDGVVNVTGVLSTERPVFQKTTIETVIENNSGSGKPVIIGDSWARGMKNFFKGEDIAIDNTLPAKNRRKADLKSAQTQITEYLLNNKPQFILCYSGGNDLSTKQADYEDIIKSCKNIPIYLIQQIPYRYHHKWGCTQNGINEINNLFEKLNKNISNACRLYNNAYYISFNASVVDSIVEETQCKNCTGCSNNATYHLTKEGYKIILKNALTQVVGGIGWGKNLS